MPYPTEIRNQAKALRKRGFSLNEISSGLNIPKTTVHDWVSHLVELSDKARRRIAKITSRGQARGGAKKLRIIRKPKNWNKELVSVVAHFMFDGGQGKDRYIYYNSSTGLIKEVSRETANLFRLRPYYRTAKNGVARATFYSADFVRYLNKKIPALLEYIPKARREEKREFLRSFFDDEGNVFYDKKHRHHRIRGYQKNTEILLIVGELLRDFEIESRVEKNEVVISRKQSFVNFRKEINLSPYLFLNPKRKNSVWKRRISKRELLDMIIKPKSRVII